MPEKTVKVYSESNDFQHAMVLRNNREKRQKYRQFFVEGVKPIEQLIRNSWVIDSFYYSSEKPLSGWAKAILRDSKAKKHFDMKSPLMQKLSSKEDTSEIIAVAGMPDDSFSRLAIGRNMLAVVLDRPQSPGNIGTIVRACESFGAAGMIVTGHAADIYEPKCIQASVGTLFSLPVIRKESHSSLMPWIEEVRRRLGHAVIVGTSSKAEKSIEEQDFTGPVILLLGNESSGLSSSYRQLSDSLARIPICGSASSLNVASAASIFLYEISRQRSRH